ncbi:MAG: hypothetical protein HY713_02270 [candidate division NC10 bacterium]|nr:hypothetical protein [candidate division NC10 bacterium]
MVETSLVEIEILRKRLTGDQCAILNTIWSHFRDHTQWVPCRLLHQRFGKPAVQACLEQLGDGIIREFEDEGKHWYRLTFLGVLMTEQGEESEGLLARYLEYVRNRWKSDPTLEWVGSQEVEAALGLTAERSRLLRQLIRLSHWWGGGSGFGDQEWTVGVPIDVDDLPSEPDLCGYIRGHVLTHFPPGTPPTGIETPRGEFWFVADPDLQRQLTLDWHEAQDVYQVRGWKSCVILCGAILERLLLDALAGEGDASAETGRPDLAALVDAARDRGILGSGTPPLGHALGEFRQLIHPGRQARERVEATRDEAEAALIAVRMCLRQMAATRSGQPAQN